MELKDYISETLVQITEGIISAKEKLKGKDVIINPNPTFYANGHFWIGKKQEQGLVKRWVQEIEMNVSTTIVESTEGNGGAKVGIGVLNLGADVKETGEQKNANSIKFTIPICLPSTCVLD
jgi:hypothetical protein